MHTQEAPPQAIIRHPRFARAPLHAGCRPTRPPPGIGARRYRIWADADGRHRAVRQGWSWGVFALPYPPAPPPLALWLLLHAAAWAALVQALGAAAVCAVALELAWRLPRARRGHRWHERCLRAQGWRPHARVLAIHAEAALLTVAIRSLAAGRRERTGLRGQETAAYYRPQLRRTPSMRIQSPSCSVRNCSNHGA
ncbi:hypothetical protein OCJ37_18610 [Xanthomonas sp. AM6]|uniref:hypothetical protein n=1 Tax=Xanthomonas sp. AM6 TaxID=2982531 RepID=UPI0021D98204|nr:hypothetical protein [Xanthomonas sp. AM6]UYB51958.1 hypothetical protein OCJ37_18610 [Xanthomonas sp. AM6]